jgi:radical SAM protein with 4Fe4S-binding SPASM domain
MLTYGEFSRRVQDQAFREDRVIKAQLELTYRCNLHCLHCYTDPYNAKEFFPRELSFDEIIRIIDQMAEIGIIWLNLTGGEIIMHPAFFEIYEYAYRKGFLLMLYTNGTVFTKAIIERLQRMPPFVIDVSCHSVNEEAFDRFTQMPGSFRAFLRGMELLHASGLPFTFKTKAMTWNKEELPAIKRFVETFDQPFGYTTGISPRLNGDLSSLAYRLSPREVNELEAELLGPVEAGLCSENSEQPATNSLQLHPHPIPPPSEGEGEGGGAIFILEGELKADKDCKGEAEQFPPAPDRLYRCGCATNTIHISAWGMLGTCTMEYEHRVSLREHHLRDAIELVFRAVRALRYTSESPCRSCHVFSFCDKKPSEARWAHGSPEAPMPYNCDLAVARAERIHRQPLIHPLRASQVENHPELLPGKDYSFPIFANSTGSDL